MRRDKNAPALLELIAKGRAEVPVHSMPVRPAHQRPASLSAPSVPRASPSSAAPVAAASAPISEKPAGDWFGPGRSIRLPVGYIIPLVLLVAALLVGAYATGYQARKAEDQRQQSAVAAREMAVLVDPLNQQSPPAAVQTGQRQPAADSTGRATGSNPQVQQRAVPPSSSQRQSERPALQQAQPARQSGVLTVTGKGDDPRQPGLNYLIAATLPPDEALKAANFLNSRGLEIAVVPADNPSLRWVVVLQGVAAKDLGGTAARGLEQRLQVLGREYRQVLKGPTVFNDPWWKKHTK